MWSKMVSYARVQQEGQVSLNSVLYTLLKDKKGGPGKVRTQLASGYPEKQQTGGDVSEDSNPWQSSHRFGFGGGIGIDRMVVGLHDNRSQFSTCYGTDYHLVKRPQATQTAAPTATGDPLIGELGGNIVVAFGTGVEDYSHSGDSWTAGRHTLTATPTDVLNLTPRIGSTEYLIFCYTSGYAYSSAIATWATSSKNTVKMADWDGRLWGIDATGQLWYLFSLGGTEKNDAKLMLSHNDVVTGLFVGRRANDEEVLFATTERHLYRHDFDNCVWHEVGVDIVPEGLSATNHERKAINFQDQTYLASSSGTINYNAPGVRHIGFDLDDGLPNAEYEQTIFCMAESAKELIVGGKPLSSNDTALLTGWNPITEGWRVIWKATSANKEIVSLHTSYIGGYREWFGFDNRLWYVRLNDTNTNPKEIAGWTFSTVNDEWISPWLTPQEDAILTAAETWIRCLGLSTNVNVKVEAAYDYDDSLYTDLTSAATIQTDGRTILTFPDHGVSANTGKVFESIRYRLTLATNSNTASPDVALLELVYRKKLRTKYAHTIDIDMREAGSAGSSLEQQASLKTAIESEAFIEMTLHDDDGNTRNFYGDIVTPQGEESTGPNEEGVMRLTFIEHLSGA